MSSVSRSFPDFLVLGAPKAGTTALCEFLQGHPSVSVARSKEPRYFDTHFDRGQGWYREKFFPATDGLLCGDGSPTYLADPEALQRILAEAPRAKMFVMLRDPAARAVSSWWMQVCHGKEYLGLQAALRECLSQSYLDSATPRRGYLHYGLYGAQIQRLYELFPEEQIHLVWSAEFRRDPSGEIDRAQRFLDLDPALRTGDLRPRWQAMGVRTALLYRMLMSRSPKLVRGRGFHQFSTAMRLLGDRPIRPGLHLIRFLLEYFEESDRLLEEVVGQRPPWRHSD